MPCFPVDAGCQEGYEQLAMGHLAPPLQSLARIIFGFLVLRHGMEQFLAYPEASHASRMSFEGILELLALPAGVLMILGLYTRQVGLVLAVLYFILFFLGPLQRGPFTHRNGGDPILLNAFFFLYLSAAGAGSLSVDRWRGAVAIDKKWTPIALGVLRIAAAGLFLMHGLEKIFGVGGGRIDRDIMSLRGLAGYLEIVGGSLFGLGIFTRPVAFVLSGEMAVAYFRTWAPRGFWPSFAQAGMEASILFCFLFLFFWAAGPGAFSLDAKRGRK
jgi:putative oxidoreductase